MLAEKNEAIASAASTVFQLVADENIRMQMEAREDYYRRQRTQELQNQRLQKALAEEKRKREKVEQERTEEKLKREEAEEEVRRLKEELAILRGQS